MLAAPRAPPGNRTPLTSLEGWRIAAMLVRRALSCVGIAGFEPATSASRTRRPDQAGLYPVAWTTGDSNPAPPVCRTGALPDELAAQLPAGMAPGRLCSRYGDINNQARSPRWWCCAGIAGVEPAFRPGWSRAAYPLADPCKRKPPAGYPLRAASGSECAAIRKPPRTSPAHA